MTTPADVLAGRLSELTAAQHREVQEAWRRRGAVGTVRRDAGALAARWAAEGELPPTGARPSWDAGEEMITQVGLDGLLGLCHPDVGHLDESRLSRAAAGELARRYLTSGWWHRSDGALLIPRRASSVGIRYPPDGGGPLAHTCALLGEDAAAVSIVRVAQEHEADDPAAPQLGAEDCAVAPIAAAGALRLSFEHADGRWTYGPDLADTALPTARLERVLSAADNAGVAVLLLPEYCASPALRERWKEAVENNPAGSVQWLAVGSGPAEEVSENIATLMSRDGRTVLVQPKTQPFDLPPGKLEEWACPNFPPDATDAPMIERARVHGEWVLLECNRGRLALAVCESFRAKPGASIEKALAAAMPTLLLCPVFSQPPRDRCWERTASEAWGELGVPVVIANSLVVADWQAPDELSGPVACAASRWLDDSARGHGWQTFEIDVTLSRGATEQIAMLRLPSSPPGTSTAA